MIKCLLIHLLLLTTTVVVGQSVNEQKKLFYGTRDVQRKAELASDLAWSLKDINPDSSLFFAEEALRLSRKSKDRKIEAYSLSDIGNYYKRREVYEKARNYYQESLKVRERIGEKKDIASGYNQLGLLYRQWEKYDSAKYYFSSGLRKIPQNQFPDLRMKILDGLGMTLFHLGDFETALQKVDASRALAEVLKDSLSIAQSWQNTGAINQYLGFSNLALKNYEKAGRYYKSIGNINGEVEMKINRASIYLIQGRYDAAKNLLDQMEIRSLEVGFNDNRSTIYLNLAHLYSKIGEDEALYYFSKAYDYGKDSKKINTLIEGAIGQINFHIGKGNVTDVNGLVSELDSLIYEDKRTYYFPDYFELKANISKLNGDFEKAFSYSQKAILFRDKLYRESGQARELLASLEIADKDKKTLAERLKRKDAEAKAGRLFLWILSLLILLLIVFIFFVRRNLLMRREQKVSELNFESEISDIIYQSELKFLEGGLELRKKIGRDLHDQLGSKLAVAQMRIDSLSENSRDAINAPSLQELKEISSLIENSCVELRSISHDLANEKLAQGSLDQAVEVLCSSIPENENFSLKFTAIGEPYSISLIAKRNLLATISLLIDNVLKHSNASKLSLQIFYHEDDINIELEDNGVGFDTHKKASGIGLRNAFSRINIIHGSIEVNSKKNVGTSISISIPIKND